MCPAAAAAVSQHGTVPYIAAWSAEPVTTPPVIYTPRRGGGIGFARETVYDRDLQGVLWGSRALHHGQGKPRLGEIHPQRQRSIMGKLGCQVCAGNVSVTELGYLFLIPTPAGKTAPVWEGEPTTHPPLCLSCAATSVRACPALRGHYQAVRVQHPVLDAVHGTVYRPGPLGRPERGQKTIVRFSEGRIRWMLAGQLCASLHDCTPVSLSDEIRTAGTRRRGPSPPAPAHRLPPLQRK